MKHFVVCGNVFEYDRYLKENQLDPHLCAYVSSIDSIRGTRNPKGIFTGTWWKRKDTIDIIHTLLVQGANKKAMGNAIDCYYRKIGELYHD
jgi:hypothetical protein